MLSISCSFRLDRIHTHRIYAVPVAQGLMKGFMSHFSQEGLK